MMNRVGGVIAPPAMSPPPVGRPGEGIQLGMGGQETPSESSEADSSECDTTGDEDGWESGESSSASLVVKRHSSSHTTHDSPMNRHKSVAGNATAVAASHPGDSRHRDGNNSGKAHSPGGIERYSGFFRPFFRDT